MRHESAACQGGQQGIEQQHFSGWHTPKVSLLDLWFQNGAFTPSGVSVQRRTGCRVGRAPEAMDRQRIDPNRA